MKLTFWVIALICFASTVRADEQVDRIYQDFVRGKITRAQKEFRQLPQTTVRDGNRLFISSLFETDGKRVYELLEASLRTNLDGKYEEEARFRMIQLAEASFDTAAVVSSGTAFLDRWEMSSYREHLLAALAAYSPRGSNERTRYLDLLIDGFPGSFFGQTARLSKAVEAYYRGHFKTASTYCRRINNSSDDNLAPASLILLSQIALKQGDSERALFNYNILREQYRHAIGQEDLLTSLRMVSEKKSGEESTEVFEGITYSVQVGVFAQKSNAERMSNRVKGYGLKTRITKRNISGNQYLVVLAGHFATMKDAQAARQKLELGENAIFKVVVNDEK